MDNTMNRSWISARGMPLRRNNIDTDQIIPARFCYHPERTGHGPSLFGDWRREPGFVLNDPRYAGARILVAGREFATGSSREYAVWAIKNFGFDVVIAQSFGDIFYKNAILNDLLPLKTSEEGVEWLWQEIESDPAAAIEIDLEGDSITVAGRRLPAIMAPHFKRKYIANLDDIAATLTQVDGIAAYEAARPAGLARTLPELGA